MPHDGKPRISNVLEHDEEITHIQLEINWMGRKRYIWIEVEEVEKNWDWPEGEVP